MPRGDGNYLAYDLGAQSGRAMIARLHNGNLAMEEISRFPNEPLKTARTLRWDVEALWQEMRRALQSIAEDHLDGIGVDAWGVDYALLKENGELIETPYHYRDARTNGIMEEVFRIISRDEIYRITGIQFMPINTLYQLFAARKNTPEIIKQARHLVTIPDLFNYWFTGKLACEFTNASTTQMVDTAERNWSSTLLTALDLPCHLPAEIVEPASVLGELLPNLASNKALAVCPVIASASHDTGSAVAAISARDGTAFLSSGTWSLVGVELDAPLITAESLRLNFTNEGGVNGTTRFLKNVMGLWMLECCRQTWSSRGEEIDYQPLMALASHATEFAHLVDPDDESFLAPHDMPSAIASFCAKTQQPCPSTPGAFVRTILESLALKYSLVVRELERLTGQSILRIRVIGGGSKNRLLNQFTANATGLQVLAGPAEATALGNVGVQMLATGAASSLQQVRDLIESSFPPEVFHPLDTEKWNDQAERFRQYCECAYA
ncbi:MAG: rhamnulokinase family protein [Candidatus Sulfotelmatobacter sp.]|jgi:rhamnulokinase